MEVIDLVEVIKMFQNSDPKMSILSDFKYFDLEEETMRI
jgi:hypothetical protein